MSELPAPLQVLISGGEGGLARALHREFSREGDHVHAPGRKEMDVRDEAQVAAYVSRLERLDVLVTNAGLTRDGAVTGLSADDFTEVVNTNLRGAFFCARAALKLMVRQRSGHIVLIGSRAARYGTRGQSAYAAAKAGLVGLAQSIAKEYGPRNIRPTARRGPRGTCARPLQHRRERRAIHHPPRPARPRLRPGLHSRLADRQMDVKSSEVL